MITLSIKEARKILGKNAEGMSDELLESEIEVAAIFKDLFFSELIKSRNSVDKRS